MTVDPHGIVTII